MDMVLNLSREQFNWLRKVVTAIYEKKVKFAKDWENGRAIVIIFENGNYIWCLLSEVPYVQGEGTFHFPRFTDKEEYYKAYNRLEKIGLNPTSIEDVSDRTGVIKSNERIGQYIYITCNIKGEGLDFELCLIEIIGGILCIIMKS